MDDILVLANDELKLENDMENAIHILELASLPTHKYVSNSVKTLEKFPKEKLFESDRVSILGTMWNPAMDEITFNFIPSPLTDEVTEESGSRAILTKRSLLSTLAKIFNSQGTLSPYILSTRLTLQKDWEQQLTWDEPLKDKILQEAEMFLSELDQLKDLTQPRCFLKSAESKITELAIFADASSKAYAAVVYAISIDPDGFRTSNLVFSKLPYR